MSKKTRRHERILSVLDANPSIRVKELADELGVSSETVRRDLTELDNTGRIARTYGGAVRTKAFEPALAERLKLHIAQREAIARLAVERAGTASSLFIGGGATTLHFARALRQTSRRLTVLTPAFSIATELSTNPMIEVMALPGIVEPKEGVVYGGETLKCIAQFRTPLAVIGASGVDADGVSEALLNVAQVYSAMVRHSDETLVLADSSKFGVRSLQQVVGLERNVCLVTQKEPEPALQAAIRQRGAELLYDTSRSESRP
ncbi:DeoR/GlpR family DNA-binding transcription regulator [Sedimentitalea todarodis]|uniref:DeoR/GlpR family DNA-binding transcription regulator n=1 Tax=Sedimentitalea todarodis TaxID=1631240 RepID=A0ABU3V919_9RHOB|nr:DeoR/GlpR family DNA-binding transcription regulator [Sedimentitalea todarodis]MDU9002593.1 DeoR/GlpR family DNA-binding transcription regulator [Sedimentitalea todarodis]